MSIIGTHPYIELSQRQQAGSLLKPSDVRRAGTISHVGYEAIRHQPMRNRALSNPEHPQKGYRKLGYEYFGKKQYELAIKAFVNTNEVVKTEEALKEWYSEILEFIKIADKDFEQNTLPSVKSALDQYDKIIEKIMEMKQLVKDKCQSQFLQAEISNLFKKITDSKIKIERLNAPRGIHEAKTCLINCSLKKAEDLPSIILHCKIYLQEARRLDSVNFEELRKIRMILNQAQALSDRLAHLKMNKYYYVLDQTWDQTFIKAIQELTPTSTALYGDHTYFTTEYIDLFEKHPDLRDGIICLSEKSFIDLMGKIQGYLTKHLVRKFSVWDCVCMHPYKLSLLPHDHLKAEQLRLWISEARSIHEIQDISDILHIAPPLRDPLEEKEP